MLHGLWSHVYHLSSFMKCIITFFWHNLSQIRAQILPELSFLANTDIKFTSKWWPIRLTWCFKAKGLLLSVWNNLHFCVFPATSAYFAFKSHWVTTYVCIMICWHTAICHITHAVYFYSSVINQGKWCMQDVWGLHVYWTAQLFKYIQVYTHMMMLQIIIFPLKIIGVLDHFI